MNSASNMPPVMTPEHRQQQQQQQQQFVGCGVRGVDTSPVHQLTMHASAPLC